MYKREELRERAHEPEGGLEAKAVWRFLERFIFYGLLVVVALTAIPYGTVEVWWIALFECAVFLLAALWFLTGLVHPRWRAQYLSLVWPLLALLLFTGLQTVNFGGQSGGAPLQGALRGTISADPYETRLTLLKLLALSLCFLMLLGYTRSRRRLRALIYVVVVVSVLSALFGILRQTTHHNGLGYILPFLRPDSGYGQFINRNHFAFLMELSFGLLLGLFVAGGVRREQVLLCLSLMMPVWFALVLSNSRGGILSMLGQLIFAALLYTLVRAPQSRQSRHSSKSDEGSVLGRVRSSRLTRLLLIVCLVGAIAFSVVWIGGDQLASRFEAPQSEAQAGAVESRQGESRREVWRATWALIRDNPLAGVGFGGYWAVIPTYHDASGELTPQQAHNDYLEILASGGIIGAILCGWLIFALVRAARRQLQATDRFRRAVCFGALVGLFGVVLHSLFDFGLHTTINSLVFVLLLVMATAEIDDGSIKSSGKGGMALRP